VSTTLETMRITTIDRAEDKWCGIEVPLRRLATSPNPLEAASWHKLLELVEHLQESGPEHELWGHIVLQELVLYKREPPDPVRDRQMERFMDEWRAQHPDPTTWGDRLSRAMRQRFPSRPGVRVSVRVDWRDYAPHREKLRPIGHR
jgi:hypothetical protein